MCQWIKKSIQIGIETHKEEIYQNLTRKNKLKTEFALVRLDKKVMWEVSHKVSSYQTLVRGPAFFIIPPFMKCYQSLVTKMTCKFAYQSLVTVPISSFKNTWNQKCLQSFVSLISIEVISIYCVFLLMFGNLRLYEIHQTPLSYQVLSAQNGLVNHLR